MSATEAERDSELRDSELRDSGLRDSELRHPILEVLQDAVLPNLTNGAGRCMPPEKHTLDAQTYNKILPYGRHHHEHYEWVWVLENELHLDIAGTVYGLRSGDFCLIPPLVPHAELYSPFTKSYRTLWASYFGGALFCRLLSYVPLGRMNSRCTTAVEASPTIVTLLSVIEAEMKNEQPYADEVRRALLTGLVHLMVGMLESALDWAPTAAEVEDLPGVVARRVLYLLNRNYAQNVSLDTIGRAVGMSRSSLCAAFKKEAGKTIGEALMEIRLERAKKLLMESPLSINEVAHAVGYTSPEHFCRIFQRHEHMPPSRYRK